MLQLFLFGIFWMVWIIHGFLFESFTNHFVTRIRKFCNFENFGSDFDMCWLPIVKDQYLKEACYCKSLLYVFGWPFVLNKVVITLRLKG